MQKYTSRHIGDKNTLRPMAKLGMALVIISVILAFCTITNLLPFIRSFFLGSIGLSVYPLLLVTFCIGCLLLKGKKYALSLNYIIALLGLYFILLCVLQLCLTDLSPASISSYLSEVYAAKITPGGVVAGVFAYGISSLVNFAGALIVFGILALVCVALIIDYYLKLKDYNKLNARAISYPIKNPHARQEESLEEPATKNVLAEKIKKDKEAQKAGITLDAYTQDEVLVGGKNQDTALADKFAQKVFGNDYESLANKTEETSAVEEPMTLSQFINNAKENSFANFNKNNNSNENSSNKSHFSSETHFASSSREDTPVFAPKPVTPPEPITKQESFVADLRLEPLSPISSMSTKPFDNGAKSIEEINKIIDGVKPNDFNNDFAQAIKPRPKEEKLEQMEMMQTKPTTSPTTVYKRPSPYVRPPLNLLVTQSSKLDENEADFKQNAQILEETLDSFKISATVESIVQGPAVTRYEVKMPAGISVNKIKQHADDIAMMMRSVGGVRIEAPIPGKNLVGIELPNKKIATIGLKDVLDSPEFHNTKSSLPFALGKNIAGSIKICDLSSMPHLLVAGSTGSGKSVCLNIIIISLLYKMGPDDLKLLLIDPKRVEFSSFNGLPHLITPEAVCQPKQALNAFDWAIAEMDRRFSVFQQLKVRNFEEYNSLEAVYKGREPKLPRIVIIVDELADLMMFGKKELEDKIMRIAQLARAAGIHLVLATQRPSVDVITGTIKTNLPSRIAFSLNNYQDSMTIINQGGAEKLLGKGDMLYFPQNLPEPVRIQCPYLNNEEVKNIVDFIIKNNEVSYDDTVVQQILNGKGSNSGGGVGDGEDGGDGVEYDPILPKALFDFIKSGNASISAIQRRYAVGYARAARIVDQMEMNGFISPADGTNKRKVLIDENKYNELFSDGFLAE